MVSGGMPPPVERRVHARRYGVSSLPPSMLVLHNSSQVPSKGCFQYAMPPSSALSHRPAATSLSSGAVAGSHLRRESTVQSRGVISALKPRRDRPLTQFLSVAQRRSMDWNGHTGSRPVKGRPIPVHSQSVQAYNQRRGSSSGGDQLLTQSATNGPQSLARTHSGSKSLPGGALTGDEVSRITSLASLNGGGSHSAISTDVSTSSLTQSTDGRQRVPSISRSRDDTYSGRRTIVTSGNTSGMSSAESSDYILSPDMEQKMNEKVVAEICRKYGGNLRTQRAARTIQLAFREYMLKKRHQHHVKTRSRLFSNPPTMEQMRVSGLPTSSKHRYLSETKSAHRPLQRIRVSPAPSSTSVASSVGESMESIVGMTEMVVVLPESGQPSTDVSIAGSETSSIDYRLSPVSSGSNGDTAKIDPRYAGAISPISMGSNSSPSPGVETGGQFEVMRRASFVTKPSDSKLKRQRQLRIGITHFNRKPSKGIQYLIGKGLLQDESRSVAVFLKKQGGLSRQMVGDYLGNLQSGFNQTVLEDFVSLFNLQSETFTTALRKFLSTFRLPGEAQKIERILQVFANRYSECSGAESGLSSDMVFILSFSTIMLNTDLHNKSIKSHMTKEEFIRNHRGTAEDGGDPPRELLEGIFDEISEREFKTSKDHVQQVLALEKTISGPCPRLSQPHRQLVHVARMTEVLDKDKKQQPNQHSRFLFLFNDMMLVAKYAPKKNGWHYIFKSSLPLLGMKVVEFSNQYYKRGIQIQTNYDGKVMMTFNGEKEETKRNFVRDLREVMAEIVEMEEERIQEMERVQRSKSSDLSPEVSRRSNAAANAASLLSQSVPASVRASPLSQQQMLVPIHETDAMKRNSMDSPRGQRPGSSVSSASGMERRSISGIDLKDGGTGPSPTPSQNSQGSSPEANFEKDVKENSTTTGWRAKLYTGKKRKSQPGHIP